jgi:hypothetical protein
MPGYMVPVMAAAVEEKKASTVVGNLVEKSETKPKQNGTDSKEDKRETLPECCKLEGKDIREGPSVPFFGYATGSQESRDGTTSVIFGYGYPIIVAVPGL